ncbi:MAG: hypothetical protein H6736_02160 [Alphaproteobacteria bacterium]|nr:hypothetical protein [Alphaproteobacteria bacterium]
MLLWLVACGSPTPEPAPEPTAAGEAFAFDTFTLPCSDPGLRYSEPGDDGRLWLAKLPPPPEPAVVESVRAYVTDSTFFGDFGCDPALGVELVWALGPSSVDPGDVDLASAAVETVPFVDDGGAGDALEGALYLAEHTLDVPLEVTTETLWLGVRVRTSEAPAFGGTCIATCDAAGVGHSFSGAPAAPHDWIDVTGAAFMTGVSGHWRDAEVP